MALTEHVLNHLLKSDLEHVYTSVLDLKKFGAAHPYMTSVDLVKQGNDHTEFFIREKVLIFGFIPQRPSYYAKVYEIEKNKHIRYTSKVMGLIDLSINFMFTHYQEKNQTALQETITLKGNKIISKILLDIMRDSHKQLFSVIQNSAPGKIL